MKALSVLSVLLAIVVGCSSDSFLSGFSGKEAGMADAVANEFTFNGYTNHWQNVYRQQYRYGNLYRVNIPDLDKTIAQSKMDLAERLGIPGLKMQEGFFNGLADSSFVTLENPSADEIRQAFDMSDDVLVFVPRGSGVSDMLDGKNPVSFPDIPGYQMKSKDFSALDAFVLEAGRKTLYVATGRQQDLEKFRRIIEGACSVVSDFDMKRGWFGTATNIQSVTCTPGTPIDVMGRGMNEGNSWFVFSGGYETYLKGKIAGWVQETGMPIVTDLGASPLFGCDDWEGFQSQMMGDRDSWTELKKKKNGYLFKKVGPEKGETDRSPESGYDGYFANIGHEKQINSSDKPFVIMTGNLLGGTVNSMVLFIRKGDGFDREKMWEAIMDRRSVAIGENGIVMGSDIFRKTVQLMMLDREYIEEYFGDRIDMTAAVEGTRLHVSIANLYPHDVTGSFSVVLPEQVAVEKVPGPSLRIPAGGVKEIVLELDPKAEAMGRRSAVAVKFEWDGSSKATMATLDMPPAVSAHQLLYGSASGTQLPVSLYNFTNSEDISLKVSVFAADNPSDAVFEDTRTVKLSKGESRTLIPDVSLAPGSYTVRYEAMGVSAETQLGIGDEPGTVTVSEVDIDCDGVNEYVMENSKVRVTLLTTGARIIEYIVKSRDDNVFFKLWPEKPEDVDRPFRERAFWPFGGFEDFLGQASMETHKVYDAEIIKAGGDYAEIRMTAEYYGNVIEKTFSLYGDTPLLGVRFALDMVNPELDVLGPQPILSLGRSHGTEDRFIIPETCGVREYVMHPRRMYGKILDLQEGWNAGYDTVEDISFVGAYPVHRPFYLHMWMNLDSNPDSRHPYVELQPWVPLYRNSTSYFSYYMWAEGGPWEGSLKALRDRNLITER